jgi:hypothetical protein
MLLTLFCKINSKSSGWIFLLFIILAVVCLAFTDRYNSNKLIFEQERFSRSSFCLYNDGRFFEADGGGCVDQLFAWGYWKNVNDTIILNYSNNNIFNYEIIKSIDSQNQFQIVRVIDCYGQPVRFQFINHNTGYTNLYNTGIVQLKKNNSINYPAYYFSKKDEEYEYIASNADTITYQWRCNRECLESINGGRLHVNDEEKVKRIILKGKRKVEL